MSEFAVHTIVHHVGAPVSFAPGDEVPEWADALIGDHVLAEPRDLQEPDIEVPADDTDEAADVPEEIDTPESEPVDFTGAKPRGTRQRRG
ncbi:hypothetical protein SRABI26_02723 [Arthrobacter sp. Bi26]|uniref:hypothetical protein n=1 Tax=Arthrobacter sp. Bi26 TaxID=2822350 RepID=UPI001D35A755|nr:hypothetical protein [Arthrobacter sp. Bi26]CAH0233941.1 hypothetical protein SRABI26_02723 [Arthrobacter sp. Bi26]